MATLSQALRQNRQGTTVRGPGGALSQESPQEIQQLAGQAGLQAPPTTPLGAAQLGANPDQQKMQGTPAQKQAALSLALQPPEQGLAATLRRQQSRTELTAQEQGQQQKNTDMQNLGNLGDRVTQFIDAQRQLLQEQETPVEVQAVDQFQGKDVVSIKETLKALRANPNDMNLQLEVNKALGRNVNTTLTPDEINRLYDDAVTAISKGGAASVDDSLTVEDLVGQSEFGYDAAEIANLLGIPEAQVAGLTVGQLRNEIQRVGDQEFSNTQRLEQQAQSGLLGQAERGLARQAAREASATGVRATEADYSNMEQQIANADQVTFGGRTYNVENLLKDETISNIIAEYMNAPEGSEVRKRLEATEPGLMEFIRKNEAVLADAAQKLGGAATEFTGIQEANKQIGKFGSQSLDEGLLRELVPEFGQLQAARLDRNQIAPLASIERTQSPEQTVRTINANLQKDRQAVDQLFKELTPDEFQNMFSQGGDRFNRYVQSREDYNRLKDVVATGNEQQLVSALTSTGDMNQFRDQARNMFVTSQLGIGDANSNPALYQAGQWAHNPEYLNNWLRAFGNTAQRPEIKQASAGSIPQSPKVNVSAVSVPGGIQRTAVEKLGPLLTGTNTAGTISLDKVLGQGMSMLEMQQLLEAGLQKGPAFNREIQQQFQQRQERNSSGYDWAIRKGNELAGNLNYLKATGNREVLDTIAPMMPGETESQRAQRVFGEVGNRISDLERQRDDISAKLNNPEEVAKYGKGNLERRLAENNQQIDNNINIGVWFRGWYNDTYGSRPSGSGGRKF